MSTTPRRQLACGARAGRLSVPRLSGHRRRGYVATATRGVASGVVGGTGPVDLNTVVTSAEADEQPQLLSAGPKRTPPGREGVPARVQFEFIVDTLGRAESRSLKVISSTNKLFEEPAREMVLKSVFKPGRQGGRAVRVLVMQAVTFQ